MYSSISPVELSGKQSRYAASTHDVDVLNGKTKFITSSVASLKQLRSSPNMSLPNRLA